MIQFSGSDRLSFNNVKDKISIQVIYINVNGFLRISTENLKDDIENEFLMNYIQVHPINGVIPKGGKLFTNIKVKDFLHTLFCRTEICNNFLPKNPNCNFVRMI